MSESEPTGQDESDDEAAALLLDAGPGDDESENRAAGWILLSLFLALFLALALLLVQVGDDDDAGSGVGSAPAQVTPASLEAELVDGVLKLSGSVPDEAAADALIESVGPAWAGTLDGQLDVDDGVTLDGGWLVLRGPASEREQLEAIAAELRDAGLNVTIGIIPDSAGETADADADADADAGEAIAAEAELAVNRDDVVLSGVVPDQDTHDRILAIAEDIWGARNVDDQITIDSNATEGLSISVGGSAAAGDLRADDAASLLADEFGGDVDIDFGGIEFSTSEDDLQALQDSLRAQLAAEPIQFETGSAQLTAESSAILDRAGRALEAAPGVPVTIEGHTDDQGGDAANLALSQARAETVLAYLVDEGIDEDRLTAVGKGETEPIADNGTAEGRAENRRIEFVFVDS